MQDCWCCTCTSVASNVDGYTLKIDPACRNHGAHGQRECVKHRMAPVPCSWNDGCEMTIENVRET